MTDEKKLAPSKEVRVGRKALIEGTIMVESKGGMVERPIRDVIIERTLTGSFAWVAAASAGISQATYFRWMRQGEANVAEVDAQNATFEERGEETRVEPNVYGRFYLEIKKASAQARRFVESKVMRDNPLAWLRYGPGRDRPGEPGWTDATKMEVTGKDGAPLHPGAGPQRLDLSKYNADELELLERLLAKGSIEEDGGSK